MQILYLEPPSVVVSCRVCKVPHLLGTNTYTSISGSVPGLLNSEKGAVFCPPCLQEYLG
jgi:hypothetical protein